MASSHEPVSALCVFFPTKQLILLTSVLSCWRWTYSSVKSVAVCLEEIKTSKHTWDFCCRNVWVISYLITGHVRYTDWGRLGNGGSKGFNRQIFVRGRVILKADISLVKSHWNEPKNCSLLQSKFVDFNTKVWMTFMTFSKFEGQQEN